MVFIICGLHVLSHWGAIISSHFYRGGTETLRDQVTFSRASKTEAGLKLNSLSSGSTPWFFTTEEKRQLWVALSGPRTVLGAFM